MCSRVTVTTRKDGCVGFAHFGYSRPLVVPAQSEINVMARVLTGLGQQNICGVVEHLNLQSSVSVARTVGMVKDGRTPSTH